MANNEITHSGIVENIEGSHLSVRIIQTSACSACSVKGYCSSADSKEKIIDITDAHPSAYQVGESVTIVGRTSMGLRAVALAFVFPFVLLITCLFLFTAWTGSEPLAALVALAILIPYYMVLWLCRARLKQTFSFTIKPITETL
ncbi:MAG: SoxR reducing system RseC family protein [Mediterranea sp.]|jgi:sigma-E factor negative regulatory protein RseC|nr:SoxR reducing system RseC family protein [Mediterranea sp.]